MTAVAGKQWFGHPRGLATLFFTAMLFVPLLREALRRVIELPAGGHF